MSMESIRVGRGVYRHRWAAALMIAVAAFGAGSSFAQTVELRDNRPAQATGLSMHAAAARPLALHVSFKLRNRLALAKLLKDQQDPASPQYHHWITPAQFNAKFGRTPAEVNAVAKWLAHSGLRVIHSSNREMISTATVAQAEAAFATRIMTSADGARFSNSVAPQIPARFAKVIGSIEGLDNLRHYVPVVAASNKVRRVSGDTASSISQGGRQPNSPMPASPATSSGDGFGPQDVWTFYDETPPLNGALDGGGVNSDCLAVIEDSDYSDSSITAFNSIFGLPSASVTRVFSDVSSPGTNSDETEALVDIEWSHSMAPGAPIDAYIGNAETSKIDPLTDSLLKAVSDNNCGTISFTFIYCGAPASFYTTTIGNAMTQAATQGQSVLAASGDWGAAGLVPNSTNSGCVTSTFRKTSVRWQRIPT